MSLETTSQLPLSLRRAGKTDVRTQFAALCYRIRNDKLQILLVTSLRGRRWILPKGWPEKGQTPAMSAAQEAWEEAGVTGQVHAQAIGLFSYVKVSEGQLLPCVALVFPLLVEGLKDNYPEAGQRNRKWFGRRKAAASVREPELAHLLRTFEPKLLRR